MSALRTAAMLVVCAFARSVCAGEPDGPAGRDAISKEASAAFQSGDFALLEQMAGDLRKTKARLPEGLWKLPFYYAGLDPKYGNNDSPDWKGCFDKLDVWEKAFPESSTQPIARAAAWVSYGWDARGTGFADTVTPEGWKLLAERLTKARNVLEKSAPQSVDDPQWYRVMQTVALGEDWDSDRSVALFDKAVAAEPTYYDYYFSRLQAELPRWGGEPDAWIDFSEEAARKDDPEEGLSVYTRIVWSHQGGVGGGFQNPKFDWKKFRQGFLDIERKYPDSNWNLNNFCRFACMADDRDTARELFERLGSAADLRVWETRRAFADWRQWAQADQGPIRPRASLTILRDERLTANSAAFSPDGKTLLAGYDDGQIRLWDLASQRTLWIGGLDRRPVAAVAFSPDGQTIAAGTGDQHSQAPGTVALWDASIRKRVMTVPRVGNVFGLAFTPDGKTLAIAGGIYGDKDHKALGEMALYDLAAQKLNELSWNDGYVLTAVAISPDGQFLVTPKGNSMNCWSLPKKEFVTDYHTRTVHGNSVQAVAISPDSKMLVTGVAPGWKSRTDPGELRRWDMTIPGWPEIKTPAWATLPVGVLVLALSPDGKWLATGGYDGSVRLWNTSTGEIVAVLLGHHQFISALAFAPDSKTVVSGSADGTIKWWDVPAPGVP